MTGVSPAVSSGTSGARVLAEVARWNEARRTRQTGSFHHDFTLSWPELHEAMAITEVEFNAAAAEFSSFSTSPEEQMQDDEQHEQPAASAGRAAGPSPVSSGHAAPSGDSASNRPPGPAEPAAAPLLQPTCLPCAKGTAVSFGPTIQPLLSKRAPKRRPDTPLGPAAAPSLQPTCLPCPKVTAVSFGPTIQAPLKASPKRARPTRPPMPPAPPPPPPRGGSYSNRSWSHSRSPLPRARAPRPPLHAPQQLAMGPKARSIVELCYDSSALTPAARESSSCIHALTSCQPSKLTTKQVIEHIQTHRPRNNRKESTHVACVLYDLLPTMFATNTCDTTNRCSIYHVTGFTLVPLCAELVLTPHANIQTHEYKHVNFTQAHNPQASPPTVAPLQPQAPLAAVGPQLLHRFTSDHLLTQALVCSWRPNMSFQLPSDHTGSCALSRACAHT